MSSFVLEWVRCCKPRCRKCPHGPYWYEYHWQGGQRKKRYWGRNRPADPTAETTDWDGTPKFFGILPASARLAHKLLGTKEGQDWAEVRRAFYKWTVKHHPDKGGNLDEWVMVSAAYDYLRRQYGEV